MSIETRIERFAAMGTRVELHVFGPGDTDCLWAARRAIEAVDDALTIHRPSRTTALNEALAAGGGAAVDDPLLLDALAIADAAVAATGGLFDPTAGDGLPGCWDHLSIDRAAARVAASAPVAFDFGGFGKGYALDRAVDILRAAGVVSALLSAGESSIAVIGQHPLGGGWPLAVPDPVLPGATLAAIEVEDAALSISSTVGPGMLAPRRAATVRPSDGRAVAHPRTAIAVEASGALAEAISTALIVADRAEAAALIAARPGGRHLFNHAAAMPAVREEADV
ncbi:FAD:protein FMN transferase [Sphingomonas sp. Y38-1Y]|uniref:FAD:protein FMN transferase n=1 Tax=Sphingomonas sp. Y38-1Y TaxID=3078265 RepID=UPI0028EC1FA3|nr:FAD:protein FMN transferase [Sphingomonas sp. Y38-1Y]